MKISLIQSSIEWLDGEANRARAERWFDECRGSRMAIFAEMFSTGFTMHPERDSERDGATLKWMSTEAIKRGMTICGSVAVADGGRYYNRLYVAHPDGRIESYDKRHLFSFAGEHERYSAGGERVIVEVEGVRILLLICYDIRFPVWCRNRGDYDMILCVANWPEARREAWDLLLRARAVENLAYLCGVNIVGRDKSCNYSGGTAAIDFLGRTVASVEDDSEGVADIEIDMEALRAFRRSFPALNEIDDFKIIK